MNPEPSQIDGIAQKGTRLYQSGDYAAAAQAFADAAAGYDAEGNPLKAAEMANNQAVALLQSHEASQAVQVLQGTPQIFENSNKLSLAGQAYGNLGQALAEAGRREEAQKYYQQAIKIFEEIDDRESLQHTAQALSQLQLNQGDAVSALFSMQRGLESSHSNSLRHRILRWLLRLPIRLRSG